MKNISSFFIMFLFSNFSYGQNDNFCNWDYTVTANNAIIALQQDNFYSIYLGGADGATSLMYIECPMWIGVFYQTVEGGPLECAGYTEWDGTGNMAITAWGDDSTTSEQDGLLSGDPYLFGLCIDGYGSMFGVPSMSTEAPFTDFYSTNGFASLDGVVFGPNPVNTNSQIIQGCWPVNLSDNNDDKELIRTIDLYGRENLHSTTFFELYNDGSVVKKIKIRVN